MFLDPPSLVNSPATVMPMTLPAPLNTGLTYNRLSIRSQKTRWGSCSSRGNISLNDQLLFLPADAVEYLMIHELCHTRHLNHSKAFWTLVQTHCPDYRTHEKLLRRSQGLVPDWFLLELYT
jgi:predicted metal-dependent hydrolase